MDTSVGNIGIFRTSLCLSVITTFELEQKRFYPTSERVSDALNNICFADVWLWNNESGLEQFDMVLYLLSHGWISSPREGIFLLDQLDGD